MAESNAEHTGPASWAPFVDYLAAHRDAVDAELAAAFALAPTPDLKRYLYRPVQEFCARGGKRVRPALVLMACEACGGAESAALPAAAAVEHFQTAALIHDDIADESETRRSCPCVHVTEGVGLAINDGDLALVEAFGCVADDARVPEGVRLAVVRELVEMMARTVEGQALDLGWARDGRWDLTPEDYLAMATLKTAYYTAASPLAIGATVAGAPAETVEELRAFGEDAGLAFQIADDLLNLVGDPASQGKDYRSDITEGKRTLLVLWALTHGTSEQRDELIRILESHTADPGRLSRAVSIIDATGAVDHASECARDLAARARDRFRAIPLEPGPAADALAALPDFFVQRER
ncbi:polyprenyl synthetase family protein [Olsenella sp. YH-ols2217]|uniref:Polyprenyl synthetase family protein n=1 Tax=Kribbibacterium absianum TaxID=3044210 RepID=A0ABT6ZMI3_9ACTN|nr:MULTISPECIES: polyprenyl synthetase family protein [unclassified Olsenella]MDJ1122320.1 polyprenyl synthetase family protein [Olsenella sp. YH-ols2216]MDJ1130266.1 polyprenyl synthetase family protein [Olsenella sp. YH-ols2217]